MASPRCAILALLALFLILHHAAVQQADDRQLLLEIKRTWGDPAELATWSAATGSHCTAWAHVSCDGAGRVISLALPNVTVSGPVPDAIGGLTSLATLDLSNTGVSGGFPVSLYSCTGLTHLDLSMNKLSGDLPADIGRLGNNLTYLALDNNGFTGGIPSDLANCPALTSLQLQENELCGEVPAALWSETKLITLLLQSNRGLNGTLPETLSANMTTLSISNNKFTGSLPASAAKLQTLDAGSNSFSGEIPAGLAAGMPLLQELILSANQLSGAIPATIATLGGLTQMNFSRNQLTGEIPVALGDMPVLTLLDLSSNQLSGSIPLALALLRLNQLNLSSNELVGKVPAVLAVSAYDRSFLGNAGLCTDTASPVSLAGLSSCAASSPGNVGLPFELLGTVCVVLVLMVALAYFIVRDIRKRKQVVPPEEGWKFTHFQPLDFVEAAVLRGLADENLIGKGGSGRVYRVECPSRSGAGDGTVVAVKRIQTGGKVDVLGHVRHTNIVKLLCYLSRAETKLVVYEYMGNGSLDKWLHGHRRAGSAAGLAMARAPSSVPSAAGLAGEGEGGRGRGAGVVLHAPRVLPTGGAWGRQVQQHPARLGAQRQGRQPRAHQAARRGRRHDSTRHHVRRRRNLRLHGSRVRVHQECEREGGRVQLRGGPAGAGHRQGGRRRRRARLAGGVVVAAPAVREEHRRRGGRVHRRRRAQQRIRGGVQARHQLHRRAAVDAADHE